MGYASDEAILLIFERRYKTVPVSPYNPGIARYDNNNSHSVNSMNNSGQYMNSSYDHLNNHNNSNINMINNNRSQQILNRPQLSSNLTMSAPIPIQNNNNINNNSSSYSNLPRSSQFVSPVILCYIYMIIYCSCVERYILCVFIR